MIDIIIWFYVLHNLYNIVDVSLVNCCSRELPDLFANPVVREVAARVARTPAQVLLRHTVQRGIAVIPKSVTPSRMQENFEVYCLIIFQVFNIIFFAMLL